MKQKFIYLFLAFSLFVNILNAKTEVNQQPFEELVVRYNHGVNLAMKKAKFEHLKAFLTQEMYNKTFTWIDAWQASNIFIESNLLSLKFDEMKMQEYSASITTTEVWKYRYINIVNRKVVVDPTKVFYKIKYYFVELEDGTWKINFIETLEEKKEATQW